VHLVMLVALAIWKVPVEDKGITLVIKTPILEEKKEELKLPEEFYFSELPAEQVGANSVNGTEMALSEAPVVSEVSAIPSPNEEPITSEVAQIEINNMITQATGLHYNANLAVKGAAGHGTTGAMGAIDRITHEILLSLEERKTLVVWLFDQSPSMIKQRSEVHDRFDRIYRELGVIEAAENKAFAKHDDKPLLTSVVAFGDKVSLLTKKPTDNLSEIKAAVKSIEMDTTGVERIFSAIYMAADEYKSLRTPKEGSKEPERNVMIIAFTDEAGEDQAGLDQAEFRGLEGRRGSDRFRLRSLFAHSLVLRDRRNFLHRASQPQCEPGGDARRSGSLFGPYQALLRSRSDAEVSPRLCAGGRIPAPHQPKQGASGACRSRQVLGFDANGKSPLSFCEEQRGRVRQRTLGSAERRRQTGAEDRPDGRPSAARRRRPRERDKRSLASRLRLGDGPRAGRQGSHRSL
jgi:hypothetical protein